MIAINQLTEDDLMLGLVLNDQLLFSEFFQASDLSLRPTIYQRKMFLDDSPRVLLCTSRNVAKTISIIGRLLRDIATYLPRADGKLDEILVVGPTESHLSPLIDRLFSSVTREPFFMALKKNWRRGDKPQFVTRTGLTIFGRIEGSCLTGEVEVMDAGTGVRYTLREMAGGLLPKSILVLNAAEARIETTTNFQFKRNGVRNVYRLTLKNGSRIRATANHPFLTRQGWKRLDEISTTSAVAVPDRAMTGVEFIAVQSIELDGKTETYDLTVPRFHNFIANDIVVHNSGTDVNMVGIHPIKVYGDEMEYGSAICHRSRLGGALPNRTKWLYAGVPNGVRGTIFFNLDQTVEGSNWSRHKFSMLVANPLFLQSQQYRKDMAKAFGGKHSPDYITQVKGEWGDEATSSFPPESLAWITLSSEDKKAQYYTARLVGSEIEQNVKAGLIYSQLRVPYIKCHQAAIGWDYGYSPDPTTFMIAIKETPDSPWRTYARVSLYRANLPLQMEILKHLVVNVLDYRHNMVSVDHQSSYDMMNSEDYAYLFAGRCKLTQQGGTVEIDLVTGNLITEDTKNNYEIKAHREAGKTVKERRKYFLTEMFRRFMTNAKMGVTGQPRLWLGYDADLESELVATVERKTDRQTVYDVPRVTGLNKVRPDQITDACRALVDSIIEVESFRYATTAAPDELIKAMGWSKPSTRGTPWHPPYALPPMG